MTNTNKPIIELSKQELKEKIEQLAEPIHQEKAEVMKEIKQAGDELLVKAPKQNSAKNQKD